MYQNDEEKPLIMPENCPPVVYPLINGYTSQDMKFIGMAIGIAAVTAIMHYIKNENIFISLGIVIFSAAVAIIIRGRDRYAENFMDKMRISKEYRNSVKSFIYQKNRYEGVEENE